MPLRRLDPELVSGFGVFQSVPLSEVGAVLERALLRSLTKGDAVFEQGQPASDFFVLLEGRLKAVQTTPEGHQVVVRHVNPGEIFGIAVAFGRTEYPATAQVILDSVALTWPSREWRAIVSLSPALAKNAILTVGNRLQDAHARIRELSTEEVERRVAHALLRLVQQAGRTTDQGIAIDFPVTRQDIADMAGTTLHTASRLMSAWESRGLIAGGRARIVVRDAHRLAVLAERPRES